MDIDLCKLEFMKPSNRIRRDMSQPTLINESVNIVYEYMKNTYKKYEIKLNSAYSDMIDVSVHKI